MIQGNTHAHIEVKYKYNKIVTRNDGDTESILTKRNNKKFQQCS